MAENPSMPRYRRRVVPGSVQHLISRFVNREFLLDAPDARATYLQYAARAFERCDWRPIGYGLMSSHVHWAVVAGADPSERLMRSLHCGFAGWLNRCMGRLGPVFADRHRNVECMGETAGGLIGYIHNNPSRAGLVCDPADSEWTSHRAYIGLDPAPDWLDVELGLKLSGFDCSAQGRIAFHKFVVGRSSEGRRTDWGADDLQALRRNARRCSGLAVEVASPWLDGRVDDLRRSVPVVVPLASPCRVDWTGSAIQVVRAVAKATGVSEAQLCGRQRTRDVTAARRLAILVWCNELARPANEIAAVLGITNAGVADHRRRSTLAELGEAVRLVNCLGTDLSV